MVIYSDSIFTFFALTLGSQSVTKIDFFRLFILFVESSEKKTMSATVAFEPEIILNEPYLLSIVTSLYRELELEKEHINQGVVTQYGCAAPNSMGCFWCRTQEECKSFMKLYMTAEHYELKTYTRKIHCKCKYAALCICHGGEEIKESLF